MTTFAATVKKVLFLDLEDTVIHRFDEGLVRTAVNHSQVRAFLEREQPDEIRLFSFAIGDDADVRRFKNWWQHWLESGLRIKVNTDDVFTTRKLFELCRRHGTIFEDEGECMLFHGKQYGFQHFVEMTPEFDDMELVLLDDSVETCELTFPRRNLRVRMVNVDELPNPNAK